MRTRGIAGLVAVLLVAAPLAGCGGSEKTNKDKAYPAAAAKTTKPVSSQASAADNAEAKSAARTAVTLVESCYVDSMDYSQCKSDATLAQGRLKPGTGPGQVQVAAATASTYRIEAHSRSGAVFTVAKDASGSPKRTCTGAGCVGGTW